MLKSKVVGAQIAIVVALLTVSGGRAFNASADRVFGWHTDLGNGTVSSHADLQESGAPSAIGVVFSASALDGLPRGLSDQHHCYDRNDDGVIDRPGECSYTHEFVIPLPEVLTRRSDIPFKWVLLNWNPVGHIPPGVYDIPHFDVHFYVVPIADVFAIKEGPCGPEFVSCYDFEMAKVPVPTGFMHSDFSDVDAVAPAMGNHLVDLTGPEFGGQPFTHSWIFGAYDGHVTFHEEMVSRAFLLSKPDGCSAIKSPPAVDVGGFYPTRSCIRYVASSNEYTVSMEDFVYREASAAQSSPER